MQRRWAVAAATATVVTVGAGTTAGAIPDREPEVWQCPGGTTMIITAGRNGWIDGAKYKAVEFSVEGTFDPAGPDPVEPVEEFKQWAGGATGGSDEITCTMHVDDTSPDGHFVADFTVVAVPA